jgi:SAM-dependent methyltransferase
MLHRLLSGRRPPTLPAAATPPWLPGPELAGLPGVWCNVCRWQGDGFVEPGHVELAVCPTCGSNARDRFLHWALTRRVPLHPGLRILECSPRMGPEYRNTMACWFDYRTSDFDARAHAGSLQLDLQAIDLPDGELDVVLCSHVLEHVPDTDKAVGELHRVLAPGGHLLLQVPVVHGRTAPPLVPEFHEDNTPVFWRFGFDLTTVLRYAGFEVELLCTNELAAAVAAGLNPWGIQGDPFDVPDLMAGVFATDLSPIVTPAQAPRLGLEPGYQFFTWHCTRRARR